MGSYVGIYISDYEFAGFRFKDTSLMSIFIEDEKKIEKYEEEANNEDDDSEQNKRMIYKTNVKRVKQRLDIMGYDLKNLEEKFTSSKQKKEKDFYFYGETEEEEREIEVEIERFSSFLDNYSFEKYLEKLKEIYDKKILLTTDYSDEEINTNDEYIQHIIDQYDEDTFGGLYNSTPKLVLRGLLEYLPDNLEISVEFSSYALECEGYYAIDQKIAKESLSDLEKVIIFTEGSTDTHFIRDSMGLLYPEYFPYFSFLELENTAVELNASRLASYVKSFSSANISNRILFLFDNDTEGQYHAKELKKQNISSKYRVACYPNISVQTYPTIGPTGNEKFDINGKACAIELYLCTECLKNNEEFIPIQWTGFNEKMKQYQGGFSPSEKESIKNRHNTILKECKKDRRKIQEYDFTNMRILLESIFTAFQKN